MHCLARLLLINLFTLLLWGSNLCAQEDVTPEPAKLAQRLEHIDNQIFELDRKRRKHRLWSSHYQREARRMMAKDLGLYRTRMRQSEENRVKARVLMDQIVSLEEEKLRLEDKLSTTR